MGCDIWAFVEYGFGTGGYKALFDGPILLPRNYIVFAALAGVRNRDEKPPLYEARGLPEDLSSSAFECYYSYVVDNAQVEIFKGFHYVVIDKLSASDKNSLLPPEQGHGLMRSNYGYLADTDFHTPSWLKLSEVINALEYHGIGLDTLPAEYQVLLDTMSSIKRRKLSSYARLVFWFSG
jgi:hypothetical protein